MVQSELLPVTSTLLFEEVELEPIKPTVFTTLPPSLITKLLLLPLLPTKRTLEFVHVDPVPVTVTMLLEEKELTPMVPSPELTTLPPSLITRLLLLP